MQSKVSVNITLELLELTTKLIYYEHLFNLSPDLIPDLLVSGGHPSVSSSAMNTHVSKHVLAI